MKKLTSLLTAAVLMGAHFNTADAKPLIKLNEFDTENFSLQINMGSKHIQRGHYYEWDTDQKRDFNEVNPGLGLQYDFATVADKSARMYATVGGYKNSFYEETYYAGLGVVTDESRLLGPKVDFGAEVHATHGYRDMDGNIPAVIFLPHIYAEYEIKENLNLRLGYLPSHLGERFGFIPEGEAVDVLTFSANYKFK